MSEKQMRLVSFETKFKMAVFNLKFVNVVDLFIQHMSYLCIDEILLRGPDYLSDAVLLTVIVALVLPLILRKNAH